MPPALSPPQASAAQAHATAMAMRALRALRSATDVPIRGVLRKGGSGCPVVDVLVYNVAHKVRLIPRTRQGWRAPRTCPESVNEREAGERLAIHGMIYRGGRGGRRGQLSSRRTLRADRRDAKAAQGTRSGNIPRTGWKALGTPSGGSMRRCIPRQLTKPNPSRLREGLCALRALCGQLLAAAEPRSLPGATMRQHPSVTHPLEARSSGSRDRPAMPEARQRRP